MITVRVTTPDDQIITRINATLQEAKEYYIAHLGTVTVEEIKEEKEQNKMKKYTQKQLRGLVDAKMAIDLSKITDGEAQALRKQENGFTQEGYAHGVYGCTGKLLKGNNTGQLYTIIGRVSALFSF